MFTIQPMHPETYRQQTRRIAMGLIVLFAGLAMLLSTLAVQLFGEPGGDNFRWNLAGVLLGLVLTLALVRFKLWSQPWMAPAVYGWQLKRNLLRITNQMHQVKAGVAAADPQAMKVLRFYHLGVRQMQQLDGNSSDLSQMLSEIEQHREAMEQAGLDPQQDCFDPTWLQGLKKLPG
jgi:hypothetical protein